MPGNLGLLLIAIGLILKKLNKEGRLSRWSFRLGLSVLIIFSLPLVSTLLLKPLENAYQRPKTPPKNPVAIVMLTGTLHTTNHRDLMRAEFLDSADRFIELLRLAKRYPKAKIIISGGSGSLIDQRRSEAKILAKLAEEINIDPKRIIIDAKARNTHENAKNTARILQKLARSPSILITSAYHMYRAMACFNKSYPNHQLIPWPVDYQPSTIRHHSFIPRWYALGLSEQLMREYAGIIAYWIADYL